MEVVIPRSGMEFNFNSARSSPYASAPSTPKRFGDYYFSAPTSPSHMTEFYRDFDNFCIISDSIEKEGENGSMVIPFSWEERPGTPKSAKAKAMITKDEDDDDDDFAFALDFSAESEKASLSSADELFDNGKIKPLKLPPRLQLEEYHTTSPRSPRSPKWQGIREAFSPRKKKKDIDPFAAAVENTRKRVELERGRSRTSGLSSNSSRRVTRSLSPLRVSQFALEEEKRMQQQTNKQSSSNSKYLFPSTPSPSSSSSSNKSSSRKWRFKDLFLFRSASEGRSIDKYPYKRFTSFAKTPEDVKNATIQSTESPVSGSISRRRGQVSPHELHYTLNKSVSQELKKKTSLPYKQGIFGWFSFSPHLPTMTRQF